MSLQDRIIALSEYSLSFETYEGNFVVAIAYKPNWKVKRPQNEKIKFYADDENKGVCYYEMPIGGDIDEVFKSIDEVIAHNKEYEKKIELFKEKTEELKAIFKAEPLSVLKTLEFKLTRKKTKKQIKDTVQPEKVVKNEENGLLQEDVADEDVHAEIVEIPEEPKKQEIVDQNVEDKISAAIKRKNKRKND